MNAEILFAFIPALVLGAVVYLARKRKLAFDYKHVLITGGSSGIGKAVGREAASRGASIITLWARNTIKLEKAKAELEKEFGDKLKVNVFSVDVSGDFETVKECFNRTIEAGGPLRMVIHCAGVSMADTVEQTSLEDYRKLMEINFFGTVNVTKAALPHLKEEDPITSRITLVSSLAGVLGLHGFSAYSGSKFAVRGFAECLTMEVKPFGITVTLNLPPDTDTPGFEEENKGKPEETKILSESAGLFSPEKVANKLLDDTLNGVFLSSAGLDGMLLTTICSGMSPVSFKTMALQTFILGPLRFVSWCYTKYFDYVVLKVHNRKKDNKKQK